MPVRNEEHHLVEAVGSVLAQDYEGVMQVVLAVGPSRDDTRALAATLAGADPRVRVVDNPSGRTPDGLNAALEVSGQPVVVRVDGHGVLPGHYVRTAVNVLLRTGAANVGGVMRPEGTTAIQCAIAAAQRSRLGMGDAPFRVGGPEGAAESVFLGVFRREWIDRVGGFDPRYARAQDWEMNLRIRRAGGVVWFTPELEVTYRPRATLGSLARQFYTTGRWRRRVVREYPRELGLRYLVPPVTLVAVSVGALGGLAYRPLAALPLAYLGVVVVGGAAVGRGHPLPVRLRIPAALVTMHLSWGAGFLVGDPEAR